MHSGRSLQLIETALRDHIDIIVAERPHIRLIGKRQYDIEFVVQIKAFRMLHPRRQISQQGRQIQRGSGICRVKEKPTPRCCIFMAVDTPFTAR